MADNINKETDIVAGGINSKENKIVTNKIGKINVYEATEGELEILKDGDSGNMYFSIGISTLSIAAGLIPSLLESTQNKGIYETSFVFLIIIALLMFVFWKRSDNKVKRTYNTIKNRM